jgi:hypothetical protein
MAEGTTGEDEPENDEEEGEEKGEEKGERAQKRPPRRRKPTLGNPDADPVRIHREYVERRIGGGGEPSPEAYARALEQWHQLPGAVSRPPTELTSAEAERAAQDVDEDEPKSDDTEDADSS